MNKDEISRYLGVGVACTAATFAFVTFFISDKNDALEIQLREKDQKIRELNKLTFIAEPKEMGTPSASPLTAYPASLLKSSDAKKLSEEIKFLEKQKEFLLKNLEEMSILSIDPRSEVGELSKQLSTVDDGKGKAKIINTLFALGDPITFQVLWSYFFKNPESVTTGHMPGIIQWIWLFDSMNPDYGTDFCIELVKGGSEFNGETAFQELDKRIREGRKLKAKQLLDIKQIALTSGDATVRMKMKMLLSSIERFKTEKPRDSRSMFQVVLDIERKLNKSRK